MTPLEISEYKRKWLPNAFAARTFRWYEARDFCKAHYNVHDWHARKYSNPDDSHVFYFKNKQDFFHFIGEFK